MPRQSFDWLKNQIINNIQSGVHQYSYGPGSSNPTYEDLNTIYGNRQNRLQTGNVALRPSDYNLFTPAERAQYGIADIAPTSHSPGEIEMFYGSGGASNQSSPAGWNPKEGGILGKIASHLPGVRPYFAGQSLYHGGQSIFDWLFGGGGGNNPDLQPTTPSYPFPPGTGPAFDNLAPTSPGYNSPPGDPSAPAPFVPPPWLMPPTPTYGMHAPGRGVDPGYIDPREANSFIGGLIDWNGPGGVNPSSREGTDTSGLSDRWLAKHNIGGLMEMLLHGKGAGGVMPTRPL